MEFLGALTLAVLSVVALIAFFLAVASLFPRRVALSRQAADEMPGRAFLLGLINTLFFAAIIFGFVALADGTGAQILYPPAIFLLVIYLIGLTYGLTGLTQLAGVRLIPQAAPNRQQIFGALTLILGCLTPFIGWFGLFIYLCLLGFGGFVLSYFRQTAPVSPPESE